MGYRPYHRDAADLLEHFDAFAEALYIPADVVEYDPFDPRPVGFRDQFDCSQRISECAAPFDVDNEDHVGVGDHGRPHVGYVLVVDVYLGWRSGPLHYDEVVSLLEEVYVLLHYAPAWSGDEFVVVRCDVVVGIRLAADDDLRDGILLRLQQNRIHVAVRILKTGGFGLNGLSHGDLRPGACGLRVEAHVLALERGNEISLAEEDPAYGRYRDGFPCIGRGSDDHHRAARAIEALLHIKEDLPEARVAGGGDSQATDLVHNVLAYRGAVDEEAVGAVPNGTVLSFKHASEILILARIEWTVAVCAVLPPEMAGVVLAGFVAPFPAVC